MADILQSAIIATTAAAQLRYQWSNPRDIFTILLIVGGDVVQRSIAQLTGDFLTPVPFSFGWVSYAMSALLSAVGDNKLMPRAESPSLLIPAKTGYVRSNQSWILGRILRDFEYWMDEDIETRDRERLAELVMEEASKAELEKREPVEVRIGLRLSVYEAITTKIAGKPKRDKVWWSGLAIAVIQLSIAIIPCALYKEWIILYVTGLGTILAFLSSTLPQWGLEKWACRRDTWKTITLTEGNGFKDCIVFLGNGCGLDFEDLATSRRIAKTSTRLALSALAIAWLVLLVSVAGFSDHTWFLVGVGGIGMIENVMIAGLARKPESFGIHIRYKEVILDRKVMDVLATAEEKYPHLGSSLIPTFFPGKLRKREVEWWEYANRRARAYDEAWETDGTVEPHALPEDIPNDHLI